MVTEIVGHVPGQKGREPGHAEHPIGALLDVLLGGLIRALSTSGLRRWE